MRVSRLVNRIPLNEGLPRSSRRTSQQLRSSRCTQHPNHAPNQAGKGQECSRADPEPVFEGLGVGLFHGGAANAESLGGSRQQPFAARVLCRMAFVDQIVMVERRLGYWFQFQISVVRVSQHLAVSVN